MKGWEFFGSIRCINLKDQIARHAQSKAIFDKYGIPVEYYKTDRHPNGGVQGCYESHLQCIKESYAKGDDYCLIFEDDIEVNPDSFTQDRLDYVIEYIKSNKPDIFMFGALPDSYLHKIEYASPGIMKGRFVLTHAYCMSRKFMERFINTPYHGKAIDTFYADNTDIYTIYPSFFYQDESPSSVAGHRESTLMNGARSFLIKTQEWYTYNVNCPIIYLILIMLVFILFLYFSNINDAKTKLVFLVVGIFIILVTLMIVNNHETCVTNDKATNDKATKTTNVKDATNVKATTNGK
jgi:GR25 family glycosyltransferase involved in LPS biosynthesis